MVDFSGITDETGKLVLEDVPDGDYIVTADKEGYTHYSGSATINSDSTEIDIELEEIIPTIFSVSVSVKNAEETPVASASVVLTDKTESSITFTGTTGSAGGCTINNVPAGTYTVTATATDYVDYTGSEDLVVTADTQLNITMVSE